MAGGCLLTLLFALLAPAHEALEHRATRLDAALSETPESWILLEERAELAIHQGEPAKVLALLDGHHTAAADALRARAHLALGDTKSAEHAADHALAAHPRHAQAFITRAQAREQLGEVEGALMDLTAAIALSPGADLALRRARLLEEAGRPRQAAAWLTLDAAASSAIAVRIELCDVQLRHALPGALACAEDLAATSPLPHHQLRHARALSASGQAVEADALRLSVIEATTAAIDRRPTAMLYVLRGTAHHDAGSPTRALADAEAALALAPSWPDAQELHARLAP
ncbi:MAG: hypothetical protein KC912_26895 [Proteobacteria bacterium]|nr:hypothetical protein [Pseudomonadota bacterium]